MQQQPPQLDVPKDKPLFNVPPAELSFEAQLRAAGYSPSDFVLKSDYQADKAMALSQVKAAMDALGLDVKTAKAAVDAHNAELAALTVKINETQGTALSEREMRVALDQYATKINAEVEQKVNAGGTRIDALTDIVKASGLSQEKQDEVIEKLRDNPDMTTVDLVALLLGAGAVTIAGVGGLALIKKQNSDKKSIVDRLKERLDEDRNGIPDLVENAIAKRAPALSALLAIAAPFAAPFLGPIVAKKFFGGKDGKSGS